MTSSNFKKICCATKPSAIKQAIKNIIDPPMPTFEQLPRPMRMGIIYEPVAKEAYIRMMKQQGVTVKIHECGAVVDNDIPFLSSTPDGLAETESGEKYLIEIKTIFDPSPIPKRIIDIAKARKNFYCKVTTGGDLELRKSSAYYHQVCGQMALTKVHKNHFIIYHPRTGELKVLEVMFNPEDWAAIFEKLKAFREKHFEPYAGSTASSSSLTGEIDSPTVSYAANHM